MRTSLQLTWSLALKHWDEVLPTASDYAYAMEEVNSAFRMLLTRCHGEHEMPDDFILVVAFWYCGYRDAIPGMEITQAHVALGTMLLNRGK